MDERDAETARAAVELEGRCGALIEAAPDGIVNMDACRGILFANSAAARMFGYTPEELIGFDAIALLPERIRAYHESAVHRYLESGPRQLASQPIRLSGQHRAGYEFPIEVSLADYQRGERRLFVGVIRDITARKWLDDAMRETAKLESLGVLAGGIAHDFNNLLTGILGNVGLALEMVGDAHHAGAMLRDAIRASERAADLTKQLLAYAGKGRFVIEPTDLSALVREISTLIRSSIPKHVTLRLDLQASLPPVEADVAQLQQLIMNLVINGAEAIPENRQGTVLVVIRALEIDDTYLAALGAVGIAPGLYVSISVQDNGVGMDEVTLTRIFDPFFTTKFTGRGLGLAAAGGIVRGHRGAMRVFSSPGQGTTFRVLLPAATAAHNRRVECDPPSSLEGRGTVLVIDDEAIVRKIASTILERYGYTVITAEDGQEGIERFREMHSQLKMVILDMTMPVISGDEALPLIRSVDPRVPVVLSSGYNEAEAARRFAGKGLAAFLQKPYTAAALAATVRSILGDAGKEP